jgi:tetratricopeptide (TPR) repeat protein
MEVRKRQMFQSICCTLWVLCVGSVQAVTQAATPTTAVPVQQLATMPTSAETVPAAQGLLPDWLIQIKQRKYQQPEAMLQLAKQYEADFGSWPVEIQANWLNEVAAIYEVLGRHREQLAVAERGLALLGNQPDPLRVELLYNMGFGLEMQQEYQIADDYYAKGMALAEQLNNEKLMIEGLANLAAMRAENNEDPKALDMLKQAYDRALKLQDKETLAMVQAELGMLYAALAVDDEARQFLEASYKIFDELGWVKSKLSVWYNLASIYQYLQKPEQALQIYDEMLKISLTQEDPVSLYFSYLGLARASQDVKRLDAALAYLEKAEQYLPSLQSTFQIGEHHFTKAQIYRRLGQTNLAMQQVDMASAQLDGSNNTSDKFFALYFEDLRASLYADTGDYEKAYRTLNKFVQSYIQLQNDKRDLDVQKLRLSFDAERQQARNELLEKDNELQALRLQEIEHNRQMQWLWTALFAATSLILSLLLLRQWRRRRAAQRSAAA